MLCHASRGLELQRMAAMRGYTGVVRLQCELCGEVHGRLLWMSADTGNALVSHELNA